MKMQKGKGYVWGLISVILDVGFFVLPIVLIKPGSSVTLEIVLSYIRILWVFFPVIAFIFAFIGKTRSEWGTKARKLCNVGAGIGWIVSSILLFFAIGILWTDVFSISSWVAEITAFVDTILIAGYLLISYIKGTPFWIIMDK